MGERSLRESSIRVLLSPQFQRGWTFSEGQQDEDLPVTIVAE
jgi:hypothetical protein